MLDDQADNYPFDQTAREDCTDYVYSSLNGTELRLLQSMLKRHGIPSSIEASYPEDVLANLNTEPVTFDLLVRPEDLTAAQKFRAR